MQECLNLVTGFCGIPRVSRIVVDYTFCAECIKSELNARVLSYSRKTCGSSLDIYRVRGGNYSVAVNNFQPCVVTEQLLRAVLAHSGLQDVLPITLNRKTRKRDRRYQYRRPPIFPGISMEVDQFVYVHDLIGQDELKATPTSLYAEVKCNSFLSYTNVAEILSHATDGNKRRWFATLRRRKTFEQLLLTHDTTRCVCVGPSKRRCRACRAVLNKL